MTSYSTLPAIVIDANVAIRAILPRSERGVILERFAAWQQFRREFFAPELLLSEAVSVIRRAIFNHWITEQEGRIAVEDVFRLGIEIIPSDARICQSALDWAGRLGGSKAYDGFYLAVAELKKAELWTADERLHNRVRQLGFSPIRWIEEE